MTINMLHLQAPSNPPQIPSKNETSHFPYGSTAKNIHFEQCHISQFQPWCQFHWELRKHINDMLYMLHIGSTKSCGPIFVSTLTWNKTIFIQHLWNTYFAMVKHYFCWLLKNDNHTTFGEPRAPRIYTYITYISVYIYMYIYIYT